MPELFLLNWPPPCQPDGVAALPVSRDGEWITLTLHNGIVVTLRTSGTEPKLKYYVEFVGKPGDNR